MQPDLRLTFLRALAVRADDLPSLTARLENVGDLIHRSTRAVRRRLDEANVLAAAALEGAAAEDQGWFLGALRTRVDVGEQQPTYHGDHTLIVTANSLDRITEKVSVPGANADVAPTFAASGDVEIEAVRRIFVQTWEFSLRLKRIYHCGDEIRYRSSLRLPSRAAAPPMSVMAPQRDCWHFSTMVNLGGLAQEVWVLDGVTPPTVNDDVPCGPLIDVAEVPQPHVEFTDLRPGLIYGLRWRWVPTAVR